MVSLLPHRRCLFEIIKDDRWLSACLKEDYFSEV
jgi:hypothetical protein